MRIQITNVRTWHCFQAYEDFTGKICSFFLSIIINSPNFFRLSISPIREFVPVLYAVHNYHVQFGALIVRGLSFPFQLFDHASQKSVTYLKTLLS